VTPSVAVGKAGWAEGRLRRPFFLVENGQRLLTAKTLRPQNRTRNPNDLKKYSDMSVDSVVLKYTAYAHMY